MEQSVFNNLSQLFTISPGSVATGGRTDPLMTPNMASPTIKLPGQFLPGIFPAGIHQEMPVSA